jgi:hypothetical protein
MTPEEYEAKRRARYERLLAAANHTQAEGDASVRRGDEMFGAIPLGQPILIGHHSERADRNYRERAASKLRKGFALHEKAAALRRRAEAAQSNHAIFGDDPAATEKLEARIARLEERQRLMIEANKLIRKGDRDGLAEMGFSEARINGLFTPDFCGRLGFPDYAMRNNSANIRRLRGRITTIEQHASDETTEKTIGGVTITDNVEANRLQITFPGKPSETVRAELKSHGFRWSPTQGVWQAYRGSRATWAAEQIITKHYAQTGGNP